MVPPERQAPFLQFFRDSCAAQEAISGNESESYTEVFAESKIAPATLVGLFGAKSRRDRLHIAKVTFTNIVFT